MARNREEPNRFLGFPVKSGSFPFPQRSGSRDTEEEPQHVMGLPVDWFGPADLDWLEDLAHPVRAYRRWARRRRLGPYDMDDDHRGPG
jgi:hypothetical protein